MPVKMFVMFVSRDDLIRSSDSRSVRRLQACQLADVSGNLWLHAYDYAVHPQNSIQPG